MCIDRRSQKAFASHFLDRITGDLLKNLAGDAEISIWRQRCHGRQREQAIKRSGQLLDDIGLRHAMEKAVAVAVDTCCESNMPLCIGAIWS